MSLSRTLFLILMLALSMPSFSAVYEVSSSKQIRLIASKLKPGDEVILASGTWHNQHIKLTAKGNAHAPIIVRAETPGKTVLTGDSYIRIDGAHIHLSGLYFTDGALSKGHVMRIAGNHHAIFDNAIVNYNPDSIETRYHWLSLYGSHHLVERNHFSGQRHSGVTAVVWLKNKADGHHIISHNYLGQHHRGNGNGFESIRIGTGKSSHLNPSVLVAHNLFEQCDGEMEIISNKSNDNLYVFNTFRQSSGTLTIRQGKRVGVAFNHFLGEGKKGTGGVRVIGEDHLVYGNYFYDLAGRAGGVISLTAGTAVKPGESKTLYPQVRGALIAENTLRNNHRSYVAVAAGLGNKERKLLPVNVHFVANQLLKPADKEPLIVGAQNDSIHWQRNVTTSNNIGYPAGQGLKAEPETAPLPSPSDMMMKLASAKRCVQVIASVPENTLDTKALNNLCKRIAAIDAESFTAKMPADVGVSWQLAR